MPVRLAQGAVRVAPSLPPARQRTRYFSVRPRHADGPKDVDEEDLHPVLAERDRLAAEALPDEEQEIPWEESRGGGRCEGRDGEVVEQSELGENGDDEDEEDRSESAGVEAGRLVSIRGEEGSWNGEERAQRGGLCLRTCVSNGQSAYRAEADAPRRSRAGKVPGCPRLALP